MNTYRIRHPKEKASKSSIIPSKILAPDHVEIRQDMQVDVIRGIEDPFDSVVLLFPSEDAVDVSTMSKEELLAIKRVVLIDSTWHQTKHFLREENVMKLKKVKILTEKTAFWRYQRIAETNLSTIEALYFFFRDFEVGLNCHGDYNLYDGRYDNILYYYVYNYWLIQKAYTEGDKKHEAFARIEGYIKGKEGAAEAKKE